MTTPIRYILGSVGLVIAMAGASPAGALQPLRPTEPTEHCANEACHSNIINQQVLHGPVAQHKCDACHTAVEPREHTFRLAREINTLCQSCHEMRHRTFVHEPVQSGNCIGCHDPHGSPRRMMLVADPARGLCLTCHSIPNEGLHAAGDAAARAGAGAEPEPKFIHGPVATGACVLCHQPHSSFNVNLLVKQPDALCNDCHAEVNQPAPGLHLHEAMKQGCTTCHTAHTSQQKYLVRQNTPELCASCHDKTMNAIADAPVAHGGVKADGGCSNCHSPHSSTLAKLQRQIEPASCLSCHDQAMATADGRTLTNMASLLQQNPDHHGPIREGSCSSCHQPHGGENANLLTKTYPPEFYAAFSIDRYQLCFSCHMPEIVTDRAGRGLTRFRDEELNLHFIHVNQEKGRTCRSCHEVHASRNPFHVRDAVPFGTGGWLLQINFEATEDGGSCSPGCHQTRSYARGEAPAQAAGRGEGEER